MLPLGSKRNTSLLYEEVEIPVAPNPPYDVGNNLVKISDLDELGQKVFQGMKELNRVQSVVFEAAYKSEENLLVCAPTGAGKTNVALMAIINELKKYQINGVIKTDRFKIIYIAPMKALAAEIVQNFKERLTPLGINVRELTGDMKMTKEEIFKTQVIVTTPEKWDVITRKKSSRQSLTTVVRLLIIDEIHLLHNERGAVIESLVARTRREEEVTGSRVRMVALSATLPNYKDVAQFLNVNPSLGLFYFDGRFRPVPLQQTFVGVKGQQHKQQASNMDDVCYEKVEEMVTKGHQVLVFVHARHGTVSTATHIRDKATRMRRSSFFLPEQSEQLENFQREVAKSKNKKVRELFEDGFGIHHAGMLRKDRNLVESLFREGLIKVLCCTSTLAWGVNLPAHAVVIKGTEYYNANQGGFVNIDIIEVLQIFGRAGRPQFDSYGEAVLITKHEMLNHYLSLLTRQKPIESHFLSKLKENLNAEICLGTVTSIKDAIEWLQYTYFNIRIRKNPSAYGLNIKFTMDTSKDIKKYTKQFVKKTAKYLHKENMIYYEEDSGSLQTLEKGLIASHFYITFNTMVEFNKGLVRSMSDSQILTLIAKAEEFGKIQVRKEELTELESCLDVSCKVYVADEKGSKEWKTTILLQTRISRYSLESFSLVSDCNHIVYNACRLLRALFKLALISDYPRTARRILKLARSADYQLWEDDNPLKHFFFLKPNLFMQLQEKRLDFNELKEMTKAEIGKALSGPAASKIKDAIKQVPALRVEVSTEELKRRSSFKVKVTATPEFEWNDRMHGPGAESWWIWMEDHHASTIYFFKQVFHDKEKIQKKLPIKLSFIVTLTDLSRCHFNVRILSDSWTGINSEHPITFKFSNQSAHTNERSVMDAASVDHDQNSIYDSHFRPNGTDLSDSDDSDDNDSDDSDDNDSEDSDDNDSEDSDDNDSNHEDDDEELEYYIT